MTQCDGRYCIFYETLWTKQDSNENFFCIIISKRRSIGNFCLIFVWSEFTFRILAATFYLWKKCDLDWSFHLTLQNSQIVYFFLTILKLNIQIAIANSVIIIFWRSLQLLDKHNNIFFSGCVYVDNATLYLQVS